MSATPHNRTVTSSPPSEAQADDALLAQAARIAEIRRQIAAGQYDTPERMEAALEAFLDSDDAAPDDDLPPPRHVPR